MELRYRIYPVNVHDFCEKCAVFAEPEEKKTKIAGLKYLPQEEFDKVTGYLESDEQGVTFQGDEVLNVLNKFQSKDEAIAYIQECIRDNSATVKFFGEMQWSGHSMMSTNVDTHQQAQEFSYRCTNPSCKYEKIAPKQYPVMEQVEGRLTKHPGQLAEPDEIIKKKLKEHVGSAVVPNAEIEELPREVYGLQGAQLAENTTNPEMENGQA
jgi:hypothetical protein